MKVFENYTPEKLDCVRRIASGYKKPRLHRIRAICLYLFGFWILFTIVCEFLFASLNAIEIEDHAMGMRQVEKMKRIKNAGK